MHCAQVAQLMRNTQTVFSHPQGLIYDSEYEMKNCDWGRMYYGCAFQASCYFVLFSQLEVQVHVSLTVWRDTLIGVQSDRDVVPAVITTLLSLLIIRPCEAAGRRRRECNHTSSTDKY